jgi:hypothetical protein
MKAYRFTVGLFLWLVILSVAKNLVSAINTSEKILRYA